MKFKLVICMAMLLLATVAMADSFNFSYIGSGPAGDFTATGTIYATPTGPGQFLVTGLTGTQNGLAMNLLGVGAFAANDNVFLNSFPFFTINGLSFQAGTVDYNLFFYNGQSGYDAAVQACTGNDCITGNQYGNASTIVGFQATQTPEPASLLLMSTGLAGLATLLRKRRS
jgi:hypothetical protein